MNAYGRGKLMLLVALAAGDAAGNTTGPGMVIAYDNDVPATAIHSAVAQAENGGCQALADAAHGWSVLVTQPGTYCMAADLKQTEPSAWLRLPHQPVPTEPLLTVNASNVSVDLARHVLHGATPSAVGLWVNGGGQIRNFAIQVRQGRIVTDQQPAVFMVYAWNR
jgi:hypothetical protein